MEHGSVYHCRNSEKKLFPCKISLKSGNRLLSIAKQNDFQYGGHPPFQIKKNHIWSRDCVPNSIETGWFFIEIWRLTISKMATVRSWIFEIDSFCHLTTRPIAMLLCFPAHNFTEIQQSAMTGKKQFLIWRSYVILDLLWCHNIASRDIFSCSQYCV